jgi:hypothetical protein
MAKKWIELFEGLMKGEIPFDGTGYILSTHFQQSSPYTVFEIIAFRNIKQFIQEDQGVTFYSDGYKVYLLYEPVTYRFRFQEPYLREKDDSIPMRWNELETFDLPSKDRVIVSKEPYASMGSFYISQPGKGNYVYYFYELENIQENLDFFLTKLMNEELKVPRSKMHEILELVHKNLEYFQLHAAKE